MCLLGYPSHRPRLHHLQSSHNKVKDGGSATRITPQHSGEFFKVGAVKVGAPPMEPLQLSLDMPVDLSRVVVLREMLVAGSLRVLPNLT